MHQNQTTEDVENTINYMEDQAGLSMPRTSMFCKSASENRALKNVSILE